MRRFMIAAVAGFLLTSAVSAEVAPPAGSIPLSQIIAKVEQRPDFSHLKEVEWDDGLYEVEYRTKDGGTREVKLDPRTGEPRAR